MFKNMAYALETALYSITRAKFRAIETYGNYKFNPTKPTMTSRIPDKAFMPRASGITCTHAVANTMQPELYPINSGSIDASGTSQLSNWLLQYNITSTGNNATDLKNLWRVSKRAECAELVREYPDRELVPWMPFPGHFEDYVNLGGVRMTITAQDVFDLGAFLIQQCNVRQFIWWQNPVFLPNLDPYFDILTELNSLARNTGGYGAISRSRPVSTFSVRKPARISLFIPSPAKGNSNA